MGERGKEQKTGQVGMTKRDGDGRDRLFRQGEEALSIDALSDRAS